MARLLANAPHFPTVTPPVAARWRVQVRGIVQGVGFRPFIYGLATRFALTGHVLNHSSGVTIEVEGDSAALDQFRAAITAEAPPLAHIEALTVEIIPATAAESQFTIQASQAADHVSAHIPADVGVCADCLRELFDPTDRRHRYPFINCTHCGPRYTIIRAIPYDRPATTMADFPLCPACAAEYHDPLSRRFHAQPIACPDCGPTLTFTTNDQTISGNDAALAAAVTALHSGAIVAIKGLGGYHLACDAANDAAVQTLRNRKGRSDKPFALMVGDLASARTLAQIDEAEAALLTSRQRPIVLVRKHAAAPLSDRIAPGNADLGLMLPYTPLHYLLMDAVGAPLVLTSGNLSGEPIAFDDADAHRRLAPLVDAFLTHNRPIHTPCDDSVMRVVRGAALPIRRSRGYTPFPVTLPAALGQASLVAVGGELKNTVCLAHDGHAFMSQHIGDMENLETLTAFDAIQAHLCRLYHAAPTALVCDQHPDYLTTRWAERISARDGLPVIRVQHHHAHIAAVLAEHGLDGEQPVIGVCLDGTGYGTDGTIWGGEVLIADYTGFRRAAHLKPVPLPGGDAAVKRPYRMALAHLWAAGLPWDADLPPVAACPPTERALLRRQFETGFQTVPTSSMGRLFDAAAALIGVRQVVSYEAQAAIELEACAVSTDAADQSGYSLPVTINSHGTLIIDPAPIMAALCADQRAGIALGVLAARFHEGVAAAFVHVCDQLRAGGHGQVVALSGGVFQNARLLTRLTDQLAVRGFSVLTHRAVPSNDGGLALGQAAIGLAALRRGTHSTAAANKFYGER